MNLETKLIDNAVIIYPKGRLDFTQSLSFEKSLGQVFEENPERNFIINMKSTDYINSSSLRVIASLSMKLKKKNLSTLVCEARGIVKRVFEITSVAEMVPILESEEKALEMLRS